MFKSVQNADDAKMPDTNLPAGVVVSMDTPVARQHFETDAPRAEVVNDVDEVAQVAPQRSSFQTMRVSQRRSALSAASSPGRASSRPEARSY